MSMTRRVGLRRVVTEKRSRDVYADGPGNLGLEVAVLLGLEDGAAGPGDLAVGDGGLAGLGVGVGGTEADGEDGGAAQGDGEAGAALGDRVDVEDLGGGEAVAELEDDAIPAALLRVGADADGGEAGGGGRRVGLRRDAARVGGGVGADDWPDGAIDGGKGGGGGGGRGYGRR
jgi:hypothetical protein